MNQQTELNLWMGGICAGMLAVGIIFGIVNGDYRREYAANKKQHLAEMQIAETVPKKNLAQANTDFPKSSKKERIYYHFPDHLGSASLTMDEEGNVVSDVRYYPFGEFRVDYAQEDYQANFTYTDQEVDRETGLMYYGARYYDPARGVFISNDPLQRRAGEMIKAGELNGYRYVKNNPLKYVDPTGWEPRWGQLGGVNQILGEMWNGFSSTNTQSADIGKRLSVMANHFSGNRLYERNESGKLVDKAESVNVKRYIYTKKRGWIDMHHFFRLASVTRSLGAPFAKDFANLGESIQMWFNGQASGWSYEDVASNHAGIDFWDQYRESIEGGEISVSEAVKEFLSSLEATDASEAPNYEYIPHMIQNEYVLRSKNKDGVKGETLKKRHEKIFNSRSKEDQGKIRDAHKTITN